MPIDPQEKTEISHYLGIDYGQADVGLALADIETKIAFPYKTLKNDKNFFKNLGEIIENENIKTAVIGVSSYFNKKNMKYAAEKVGKLIENKFKIEVAYQNEMFTTKLAQAKLIEKGVKNIKHYDDQEAARIILQEWLDHR